jgi:hypothetical protein
MIKILSKLGIEVNFYFFKLVSLKFDLFICSAGDGTQGVTHAR